MQLCQNFGISRGGGLNTPLPPAVGTPLLFTMYIFISENSDNLDQQFQAQHTVWCYSLSGNSFDVDSNMHKNLEV